MRSLFATVLSLAVSTTFITACASQGEHDELAGETAEDDLGNADGKGDVAAGGVYTYFAIKGDMRKCAFPMCGGDYLERLNRTTTVCHDGKSAARCYTPELDWSESGLKEEIQGLLDGASAQSTLTGSAKAIVRGRFARYGTAKGGVVREMGRFIVTEAWIAQGTGAVDGVFVKIKDNGRRCITAPCASTDEAALNTSRTASIAEVDFAEANLGDDELANLSERMAQPSGLIIAGDRYSFKIQGRSGKGRTATNVFAKLENPAQSEGCFVGGCSSQVCSEQEGIITTCEFRPEYACYQQATCERQADGGCGWTETPALEACLAGN
jgi:hypothetical protein